MSRVVILSPGGKFLDDVLDRLDQRVQVEAVVQYRPSLVRAWRSSRGARGRVKAVLSTLLRPRGGGAPRRVRTGALNGRGTARRLRALAPDWVVLARCELLGPALLSIPRRGTLNVHPGLLPWIRGNSPVANSVLRGVPLGSTAFVVDPGIDTGPLIERRLLPVAGGETQAQLRDRLYALWVEMTADLVAAAASDAIPAAAPQPGRHPICGTVADAASLSAADEAIRQGAARTLFDRWRPFCDPDRFTLPLDLDAFPG
jgi:methionyl-tRNA formyltransferase